MKNEKDMMIAVVPLDSDAARESMKRLQIAMWVHDGAKCIVCKHKMTSVDDYLERNPRFMGWRKNGGMKIACDKCYTPPPAPSSSGAS